MEGWSKQILCQDVKPPPSMTKVKMMINMPSWNNILAFGEYSPHIRTLISVVRTTSSYFEMRDTLLSVKMTPPVLTAWLTALRQSYNYGKLQN